ncbi:hypothetical protein QQM41_11615 [Acetobacter sp. AC2005]|uniref:hypothetical protein n=1 Tax=Acetobacter sp. AC2005 TaxID=3134142 RepID=UPI0030D4796E
MILFFDTETTGLPDRYTPLNSDRQRCAKICDEFTPDKGSIADDAFLTGRYLALAGIAEKIRNLGSAP